MDANPGGHRRGEAKSGAGRLRLARLAVLVLALAAPGWTQAQPLQSTRELAKLKPQEADRTVRRDLLSIFPPVNAISSGMSLTLHDLSLTTRPYGTHFAGLCRRDVLSLRYAPTTVAGKPGDRPVQPYGVEAAPAFHASGIPTALRRGREAVLDVWREDCDRLPDGGPDGGYDGWFSARDDEQAASAITVLMVAADKIRSGGLKADCNFTPNNKHSCEQAILDEADPAKVTDVEDCSAPSGGNCVVISAGGYLDLTITWRPGADDGGPPQVDSIKAAEYVIVT